MAGSVGRCRYYRSPEGAQRGGGVVFNVGTTDWAYGLVTAPATADCWTGDEAVRQVTRNVIRTLSAPAGSFDQLTQQADEAAVAAMQAAARPGVKGNAIC